jgi:hypothetical protein
MDIHTFLDEYNDEHEGGERRVFNTGLDSLIERLLTGDKD